MRPARDFEEAFLATGSDAAYFLHLDRFDENFRRLEAAFTRHYEPFRIGYSVKTNYIPRLCRRALDLGALAEVVSEMEFDLAVRIGATPARIIINGPYKTAEFLEKALPSGATVNVDSLDEIRLIEALSARSPQTELKIGIRCNLDLPGDAPSRFGFDVSSPSFRPAIERIRGLANVTLAGLHSHRCTRHRSAADYAAMADSLINIAGELFRDAPPEFINIGGGFFSPMPAELSAQFPGGVPSFDEYGQAIASRFRERFGTESRTALVVEPGLALVANALSFFARVVDVKNVRGKTYVVVSGSVYNIKPTKSIRNLPMRIVPRGQGERTNCAGADIVGYTCMEDDVLFRGYDGSVAIGDLVVFENVGAYTVVLKPPFIQPCPAIYELDESGAGVSIVKRSETGEDIFRTFDFGDGVTV